jgi:hypothetical protein
MDWLSFHHASSSIRAVGSLCSIIHLKWCMSYTPSTLYETTYCIGHLDCRHMKRATILVGSDRPSKVVLVSRSSLYTSLHKENSFIPTPVFTAGTFLAPAHKVVLKKFQHNQSTNDDQ